MLVYILQNKINNKHYVGQTTLNVDKRISQHLYDANKGKNYPIYNAIRKYNIDNFDIKTIQCNSNNQEDLDKLECDTIINLNSMVPNGYNLRTGGSRGKHSEESKKKMSEAAKGKIVSKETRRRISKARKGKNTGPRPEEVCKKIAKTLKGHGVTKEARQKMSKAKTGCIPWNKGKTNVYSNEVLLKKAESRGGSRHSKETIERMSKIKIGGNNRRALSIMIIHPDGKEEYFDCMADACRKYNLHSGSLSLVAQNRQKKHKGFKCRYLN